MLTIDHRLSTVVDTDTIVVVDAGRIAGQGAHLELLTSDTVYARLVESLTLLFAGTEPAQMISSG